MGHRLIIAGALALITSISAPAAEVYFCSDATGKKSAQDHPCSESAVSARKEDFQKAPPPAVGSEAWKYRHQQRWDQWSKDMSREINCKSRRRSAKQSDDASRKARTNEQAAAWQDHARRSRNYVAENCVGIGY